MPTLDLLSPQSYKLDRRDFLRVFGGGLIVCLGGKNLLAQESGRTFGTHDLPKEVGAWINIASDGKVTVFTGKIECGQNIRTSLAQVVAEELMLPFDAITMVMGDTDLTPWDAGTFGSQTTPNMGPILRKMAATARQTIVETAAKQWDCPADSLTVANGKVTDPHSQKSLTYGEITRGEKLVTTVPADLHLIPAKDWKLAGTAVYKAQGRDFVTGKHEYPSDIRLPGMLFGKVLRSDKVNATLVSADTSAAEKIPGVKVVRDGDFVGVVAPDAYSAEKAVAAIKATWKTAPQPSNATIFEYLKANPEGQPKPSPNEHENNQALAAAEVKLSKRYTTQYIAHAPLEPRAAVAKWEAGKLTVWTGTQRPFGVRDELVSAFKLTPAQVRVIQPDMGSGYGGKHTGETAMEAARLAKAAGAPVRLVWTRQEEFMWAYLRPAALMELEAGIQRDGKIIAWTHHNYNSGNAGLSTPYNVPTAVVQYHPANSPLRQGSYRGLASTANHFARESFMDELAHSISMDPLEFRLKNLTDQRLIAVLKAASDKFGWGKQKSTPERGFGIACGQEKGGWVATCAEVAIDSASKKVKVVRVTQAWESGAVVNPDGLHNQNMGAIIQGIGGALFEALQFNDGRILNPHFADYRLPRFSDTPQVEIVLLNRKDITSAGAGETGLVGLAPAVGNAIFAATGSRLRNMPMAPSDPVPGIDPSPLTS